MFPIERFILFQTCLSTPYSTQVTIFYNFLQFSTIFYNFLQFSTIFYIFYNFLQLSTIFYNFLQFSTIFYNFLQSSTIFYNFLQTCTGDKPFYLGAVYNKVRWGLNKRKWHGTIQDTVPHETYYGAGSGGDIANPNKGRA